MGERIRHFSIRYNKKRIAWFKSKDYSIDSNDEAQIADDGYMGHSDGAIQTSVSTDAIVPVRGIGASVVLDQLNKKYVEIGIGVVDGKAHMIEMRCIRSNFTTDEQTGALTGKFEFQGGKPKIIG